MNEKWEENQSSAEGGPESHPETRSPNRPEPTSARNWEPPLPEELDGKLPGYRITGVLGRGGMGAVYRATQTSLYRTVAIKILIPGLGKDPHFEARFQREARSMARLNHPNIVQVHDFGHAEGDLRFLVMEYVEGIDLRRHLQRGGLDLDEVCRIVCEICDALQYAHGRGLVHRDLKPANIFVTDEGRIKIGDFGLAKLGEDALDASGGSGADLTLSGMSMGTPHYMAPEQQDELKRADRRSDIFSLGVIFYELLTGVLPRGALKPPSSYRKGLGRRMDGIVFRAIDPDPEHRPQTATDLKSEVQSALSDQEDEREKLAAPPDPSPSHRERAVEETKPVNTPPECLVDADRPGLVRTQPDRPPIRVAPMDWLPGLVFSCPYTGEHVRLPDQIPLLEGDIRWERPGEVFSPFSGSCMTVPPKNWRPHAMLRCPETDRDFRLPERLPPLEGQLGSMPGCVLSPYASGYGEFAVDPRSWEPGGIIRCPETGLEFRLPDALPPLEGRLEPESGRVFSPYARESTAVMVFPKDWRPGAIIKCPETGRDFRLPESLPRLPEGQLGPGPGQVLSPYGKRIAVPVPPEQWRPESIVMCPQTGLLFRLPRSLPPLPKNAGNWEEGAETSGAVGEARPSSDATVRSGSGKVGRGKLGARKNRPQLIAGGVLLLLLGSIAWWGINREPEEEAPSEQPAEPVEVVERETSPAPLKPTAPPIESEVNTEQRSSDELLVAAAAKQDLVQRAILIEQELEKLETAGDRDGLWRAEAGLAEIYEKLELWEKAESLYEKLADSYSVAFLSLGRVRNLKGDSAGALEAYREYANSTDFDEDVISELMEAGAVAVLRERGEEVLRNDYRLARGSFEAAITSLREGNGLGVLSDNVELRELEKKVAETYLVEGDRLAENGNWEAAKSLYARVETIDPSAAGWRMGIMEEKRMAASDLEINPLNMGTLGRQYESSWQERDRFAGNVRAVDALVSYGRLLNNNQNPGYDESKALQIYEWAAGQGNGHAAYLLGRHHHVYQNYDNAVSWYEKAQSLGHQDPSLSPLLNKARDHEGGGKSL